MLKKSLFKKNIGNDAVTDMVGTLLLLMIAIALFSIVYFAVFSFEPIERSPSANIIAYVNDKNVSLEHWGGASLDLDETRVLFNIGGNKFEETISSIKFSGDKNSNGFWDLGEILTYQDDEIVGKNVDIKILDLISNSIFMSGVIQIGNRAPWIPSSPNPFNESIDVNTITLLTWAGGDPNPDDIVTYHVYFEEGDSTPDVKVRDNQTGNSYNPNDDFGELDLNTKYYWQIIAWDDKGESSNGPIWEFTTIVTPINNSPIISNQNLSDGTTGVSIYFDELSVLIEDPEGDEFDWTIETSPNINTAICSGTGDSNGTKKCTLTTPLDYSTTYTWYVNATDPTGSGEWTNISYIFTTGDSGPPTFLNENPTNTETDVSTGLTVLSIDISDPEGDLFDWTIETSPNIGSNSGTGDNDGTKTCSISGLTPLTIYTWYVNATDPTGSGGWTNVTYIFTTQPPYVQFFDSFENGEWNGLWVEDIGRNDWYDSTQRSTDGSYSAELDGTNNSIDSKLTMANNIDLSNNNSAMLTFSWYIENWGAGEYISLDIYDGSYWVLNVRQLQANIEDSENVWHDETVDLSSYLVNNFKIRFRATADHKNDDGNIDNVKIETT